MTLDFTLTNLLDCNFVSIAFINPSVSCGIDDVSIGDGSIDDSR